jgi:CheY-like chemotaxis protein
MTKPPQTMARKTCLVVDDSRAVRKVARRILEELRFVVVEAADGKLAIEHCLAEMPDVVLLDWSMPVMSGIEFLRQLRRTPGGDVPVVLFLLYQPRRSRPHPGGARRRRERIPAEAVRRRDPARQAHRYRRAVTQKAKRRPNGRRS